MLTSVRHEVPDDLMAFNRLAMDNGWGDGLPLIPPTPERVEAFLAASSLDPALEIALIPPIGGSCTVEKIAVNAVMAGAPPESLGLLVAALDAMSDPDFELFSLNATTGSVVPAVIVNGPIRNELPIPYGTGCLGGVAGPAPAIGRAIRLVMRNVGGQVLGITSQSTFSTPGRVAGIVFGEWEERSPWAPLAERRGVTGNAVTVYGAMGSLNVCDTVADSADLFLSIVGRSAAVPGANGFLTGTAFSEVLIAFNPIWADVIGKAYPNPHDIQQRLYDLSTTRLEDWPVEYHASFEEYGRVEAGKLHLVDNPEKVLFMVAGGAGSLHALIIHSWGATLSATRPIT